MCYDLAEVYAQLGEWEAGNRYWEEGLRLAETLNDETAWRDLTALERTYPRLRSGRLTVVNWLTGYRLTSYRLTKSQRWV